MRDGPPLHRVLDAADRAEARADRTETRKAGRGRLSSMDLIPEEGQDDVIWAVGELNKRERPANEILFELNDRLAVKDIEPISKSAFNRRSVKLAAMSGRLNEMRHVFQGIAPQFTAERVDENTLALGEFIKLLLFELVQAEGGAIGTKGAMELARAHLAVIQGQKISSDRRHQIEKNLKERMLKAAETAVGEASGAGHVADGAAVLKKIREDVYGIFDRS